jgi:hypothetical protein
MRQRAFVPALLLTSVLAAPAVFADRTPPVPENAAAEPKIEHRHAPAPTPRLRAGRAIRQSIADLDARVLASLLALQSRGDFDLQVRVGDLSCEGATCSIPLAVKLPDGMPPMRLAVAVANARGELSEVKHVECLGAVCNVQLVVDRGRNTISVGAADGLSQTSAFALTTVTASPGLEANVRGRSEWF